MLIRKRKLNVVKKNVVLTLVEFTKFSLPSATGPFIFCLHVDGPCLVPVNRFRIDRGEKRRPKIGKMGQKLGGLIFGWPYNQLSYFSYLLFACGWAYNWDFTVCALL